MKKQNILLNIYSLSIEIFIILLYYLIYNILLKKKILKEKNMEENKKNIWCGLDVSTTTIGCSIIINDESNYGQLVTMTHVKPKVSKKITKDKDEALYIKVEIFREQFLKKYKYLGINKVIIEEPLINSTNAITCAVLCKFNGMISLAVYEEWGVRPIYISSYDARKYSFPDLMSIRKYDKDGNEYSLEKITNALKKNKLVLFGGYSWDIDKKTVMQQKVAEIFPNIKWIYNKNNELTKENYDATDSYVCLLGQMNKEKYGELNLEIIKYEINNNIITYQTQFWNSCVVRKIYLKTKKRG